MEIISIKEYHNKMFMYIITSDQLCVYSDISHYNSKI